MSIRRNIVANYIGVGFVALAPILALPWYIKILEPKYWGLVSFISILNGILGLASAGLSQTLVREFARQIVDQENGKKRIARILFGFERIYWIFAIFAAIILDTFAGTISIHWMNLGDIPVEIGRAVVSGAAAIFAVQFPLAIYRNVLLGCGEQVKLNLLQSVGAVMKHIGGVLALFVYPSIFTYLIWFVIATLLETLITAQQSWLFLQVRRSTQKWNYLELKKLYVFALSMSASVILGVLTMQVDKLVISWMMPIEQLGYYSIASAVAIGLLQIFSPIASAVQPKIVQLHEQPEALKRLNLKVLALMMSMLGVLIITFLLAGKAILALWLHNQDMVEIVYPIMTVLVIGTGMNGIYNVGYMNWLSTGAIKKILQTNTISLLLALIITPLLIIKYGLIGAACGWLILNCVGLILSLDWLKISRVKHA